MLSGTSFKDQDLFNSNSFTVADVTAKNWDIDPGTGTLDVMDCNSGIDNYHIVGGVSFFGKDTVFTKTYNSLDKHFRARITFYLLKIDNWNNNLLIKVDTNIEKTVKIDPTQESSITKICGDSNTPESLKQIDAVFPHSNDIMKIQITTDLTTTTPLGYWGIYDLSVSIDKCDQTKCLTCSNPTTLDCLSCQKNNGIYLKSPPGPSECVDICPDGTYPDSTSFQCENCHTNCKICNGPNPTNCLGCLTGKFLLKTGTDFTCESQCPTGYFPDVINNLCSKCDVSCTECK